MCSSSKRRRSAPRLPAWLAIVSLLASTNGWASEPTPTVTVTPGVEPLERHGVPGFWVPEAAFRELAGAHASLPFEIAAKERLRVQVRTERALATVYARSSSSAWALLERSDERWKACEEDLTAAEGDADRLRQDLQREARWSAVFDALKVGGSVAATLLLVHVARNTP